MLQRKRNGIFLPHFQGQRLVDFPQALADILDKENVNYYNGVYRLPDGANYVMPATEDTLLKVHSQEMINLVKRMGRGLFEGASYSAGVTVQAALEIYRGNIDNAFVFTGFGDHHAGRNYFGGMCYFNGAAVAIATLRERGMNRFAIVDTDSHHADGTRDIFGQDREVLHICFCFQDYSDGNNNVDVAIPCGIEDEALLQKLRGEFVPRVNAFRPELIFWEFGYDATRGEYGDKGLTRDCHLEITRIIKATADALCHGRLITILCGGSSRYLATYIIPGIIAHMAELD
ncbi:MAG: hypothetical protein QMD03_08870 [Syntrophales bacterium]|nr:hypothetical protein [Syntrophales bacterium]